jgi:heptosyltransferase-2
VRAIKFDVLIDLHDNLRSNFISLFSGIPKKLKIQKNVFARRIFVQSKIRRPGLEIHNIERYVEAIRPLAPQAEILPPEVFPSDSSAKRLEILVVQTAFLGDAVLTTPILSALKNALPSCRVTLLCTPETRDVFTENKNMDEILVMDKKGKDRSIRSLWRWGQYLRGKYDMAILPHRSFRSALLTALAGIPKRVGFANSQGRMFLTDRVDFDWKMHDAERNLRLLEPLGIRGVTPSVKVNSSADWRALASAHELNENVPWVGMNPGSVWATKRWLPEGFASVADELIREMKGQVLLFGSEKDRPAVEAVTHAMKETPVNLCGKTDLKVLSALIARCRLFVTNDSGPMHLASAAQVPVVAIFGPTTRELGFFPYGPKSTVVELDMPCRPCSLHGGHKCPLNHFKCMRDVTPEMVLSACRNLLAKEAQA